MFENRMSDISRRSVDLCINQISERASGVCARTLDNQIVAMRSAAREMFNQKFDPKVHRVVPQLQHLEKLLHPDQSPWLPWLALGTAFVTGAALTWVVVVMIWFR